MSTLPDVIEANRPVRQDTVNAGERHQDKSDAQLVEMWLHGKSEHTQRYYVRAARGFFEQTEKRIGQVDEADVQRWKRTLEDYAKSTQATMLNAVRSLFSFAKEIGYIKYNPVKVVKPPKPKDRLHERLLSPSQVQRMIGMAGPDRDEMLLRTLYLTGCRVSELCGLTWADLNRRKGRAELTVFGKGSKTRRTGYPRGTCVRSGGSQGLSWSRGSDLREPRGWAPYLQAGALRSSEGRRAGRDREGRLPALAEARTRLSRARQRGRTARREGHPRPRLAGHHHAVRALLAGVFERLLPAGLVERDAGLDPRSSFVASLGRSSSYTARNGGKWGLVVIQPVWCPRKVGNKSARTGLSDLD